MKINLRLKLIFAAFFALSSLPHVFADTHPTTDTVRSWVEADLKDPQPLSSVVVERAKSLRFIFVSGFLNEGLCNYFEDNVELLVQIGVKKENIHVIYPPSKQSIEENSGYLHRQLLEISKKGPEKWVIFAHSKGAAETVAMALQNAAWVRDHVKAMYLVQGALGGSGIADYLSDEKARIEVDDRMPTPEKIAFELAKNAGKLLDPLVHSGLASLTHAQAKELWSRLLTQFVESIAEIDDLIFYIKSSKEKNLSKILSCTGAYLQTYYGKNDGLLTLDDQEVPGLGKVLTVLEADHADLVAPMPVSNTPSKLRHALMKAVLKSMDLP